MEKRTLLALAFSFLVLLLWSRFMAPQPSRTVLAPKSSEVASPEPPAQLSTARAEQPVCVSSEFEFNTGKARIIFIEPQAAIKEVIFDQYQSYAFPLTNSLEIENQLNFTRESASENKVTYVYEDADKKIYKHFIFSKLNYSIDLDIVIENKNDSTLSAPFSILLGSFNPSAKRDNTNFHDLAVSTTEKLIYPKISKEDRFDQARFISFRDKYFCAIISSAEVSDSAFIRKAGDKDFSFGLTSKALQLAPGASTTLKYSIYLGPQDQKIMAAVNPDFQTVIYYGKLDLVAQAIAKVLEWFFSLTRSWGWAIILLSLLIYLVLYPLTLQQMKSMKEMQIIQPQVEALRKTYKDNPQRLNKETLELYRQHKVNPFGGCLPLVLQVPIFFSLYMVLSRSIALKGANFLWMKDLSAPDRLFVLPADWLLNEINILPVLMAIGMFVQQKLSLKNMTGAAAEQQKMMLYIMPIMFGVLFYRMPSGLVLYWFINSSLTLVYQFKVAKAK